VSVKQIIEAAIKQEYHIAADLLGKMSRAERKAFSDTIGVVQTIIALIEDVNNERK